MMHSSIRFSLVGAQVGWTTKMSRARTFCWISTSTSPSEKRPTLALPSSIARCVAISCASAGFALPVNRTVLKSTIDSVEAAGRFADREDLAGEEGFEPSHVGIKIRCLNQLGDSPTQERGSRRAPENLHGLRPVSSPSRQAQPASGWRSQRAAHPARPARGPIARHRCRWRRAAGPPVRTPRFPNPSCGCCRRPVAGAAAALCDLGAKPLGGGLQVVASEALGEFRLGFPNPARLAWRARKGFGKARDYSSGDAIGHLRAGEDVARGECRGRLDDGEPRRRHVDRGEPLADALDEGVARRRGRTARRRPAPGRSAAAARAASRAPRAGSAPAASRRRRSCRRPGRRPTARACRS